MIWEIFSVFIDFVCFDRFFSLWIPLKDSFYLEYNLTWTKVTWTKITEPFSYLFLFFPFFLSTSNLPPLFFWLLIRQQSKEDQDSQKLDGLSWRLIMFILIKLSCPLMLFLRLSCAVKNTKRVVKKPKISREFEKQSPWEDKSTITFAERLQDPIWWDRKSPWCLRERQWGYLLEDIWLFEFMEAIRRP